MTSRKNRGPELDAHAGDLRAHKGVAGTEFRRAEKQPDGPLAHEEPDLSHIWAKLFDRYYSTKSGGGDAKGRP